ncbi:MAG: DUF5343 domain-containing protein [Hydrogenophilaceae bacterium]|nr:DUF5343 domain-containing protein [Hydrogenophilaceae bacterium]
MAEGEKRPFPQLPATVWWGLRDKFKRSIPNAVTETFLAVELNVQPAAAKFYLTELKRLGLLDDDGKPRDVAKKWRMDDTYREASDEMLHAAYPRELIDAAPPSDGDREKAVRWFMTVGDLGEGAARNKAATYFMIGASEPPDEAPRARTAGSERPRRAASDAPPSSRREPGKLPVEKQQLPPLNVNVQIHISADANNEQIESIFANMKKYLT